MHKVAQTATKAFRI